ncbi:MAG TPA: hypothetical protein VFP23_04290 [Solirubrobacterales bacterium]|nr:hypothetical protein [Solirubrobacterales bacterium]
MRDSWTDERLDDFAAHTDKRFDEVGRRFDTLERRVDDRFDRVDTDIKELRSEMNARFDSIQRAMFHGVVALSAAYIAGFAALIGLLATQL